MNGFWNKIKKNNIYKIKDKYYFELDYWEA